MEDFQSNNFFNTAYQLLLTLNDDILYENHWMKVNIFVERHK